MEWGPLILAFTLIGAAYYYNHNVKSNTTGKSVLLAESQVILAWNQTIKEPVDRINRIAVG